MITRRRWCGHSSALFHINTGVASFFQVLLSPEGYVEQRLHRCVLVIGPSSLHHQRELPTTRKTKTAEPFKSPVERVQQPNISAGAANKQL